jgi:uncharacterized protein DUF4397
VRKAIVLVSIMLTTVLAGCSSGSSSSRSASPPVANLTTVDFEVVHASQDAPPVNVSIGGTTIASGADFGDSAFVTTTAGDITIEVEGIIPGGNQTVISATDTFSDGQRVTIFAADEVANIGPIILADDQAPVAATDVRVIHGSPAAGNVDIYVVGAGTSIDNVEPNFPNTAFFFDSGYVSLAPGSYDVVITAPGDKMPAIPVAAITVDSGGIYTAIASDSLGGGAPVILTLADDFI